MAALRPGRKAATPWRKLDPAREPIDAIQAGDIPSEFPRRQEPVEKVAAEPISGPEPPRFKTPKNEALRAQNEGQKRARRSFQSTRLTLGSSMNSVFLEAGSGLGEAGYLRLALSGEEAELLHRTQVVSRRPAFHLLAPSAGDANERDPPRNVCP